MDEPVAQPVPATAADSAVDAPSADGPVSETAASDAFANFSVDLARHLQAYGAAVEVVAASEDSLEFEQADLRIWPRLSGLDTEPEVVEHRFWSSLGIWMFTWIGGLVVRDHDYDYVDVSFEVRTSDASPPIDAIPLLSAYPIALHERANAWLWALPCVLYPPMAVPDSDERLRESLELAVPRVAAERLTSFLKHDFEAQVLAAGEGSMTLRVTVDDTALRVAGEIVSRDRAIERAVAIIHGRAVALPAVTRGWDGEVYRYATQTELPLRTLPWGEAPQTITVRATADREFSRTFAVEPTSSRR